MVFIKEAASMNVLFKPLFDIHSSRATHTGGGDGLLVPRVNDIAGSEHTGNRGHGVLLVNDVTVLIGFNLVSEEIGDGCVADGDESTGGLDGFRAPVLRVFEDRSAEAFLVGEPFLDLSKGANFDFWVVGRSFVHDG